MAEQLPRGRQRFAELLCLLLTPHLYWRDLQLSHPELTWLAPRNVFSGAVMSGCVMRGPSHNRVIGAGILFSPGALYARLSMTMVHGLAAALSASAVTSLLFSAEGAHQGPCFCGQPASVSLSIPHYFQQERIAFIPMPQTLSRAQMQLGIGIPMLRGMYQTLMNVDQEETFPEGRLCLKLSCIFLGRWKNGLCVKYFLEVEWVQKWGNSPFSCAGDASTYYPTAA